MATYMYVSIVNLWKSAASGIACRELKSYLILYCFPRAFRGRSTPPTLVYRQKKSFNEGFRQYKAKNTERFPRREEIADKPVPWGE